MSVPISIEQKGCPAELGETGGQGQVVSCVSGLYHGAHYRAGKLGTQCGKHCEAALSVLGLALPPWLCLGSSVILLGLENSGLSPLSQVAKLHTCS